MIESQLLGLSADVPSTPRLDVHLHAPVGSPPASWGVAWYPEADINSSFMKDTDFRGDICINRTLPPGESFETPVLIAHSRLQVKRAMRSDAQPFRRPYGRKEIAFAHSGDLELLADVLPGEKSNDDPLSWSHPVFPAAFTPAGRTDSERFFCRLLQRAAQTQANEFVDVEWPQFYAWLCDANQLGTMSLLISNGSDLIAYRDAGASRPLWWTRHLPPRDNDIVHCGNYTLNFEAHSDDSHTFFIISSQPDPNSGQWQQIAPGQMLVVRGADILWDSKEHGAPGMQPILDHGTQSFSASPTLASSTIPRTTGGPVAQSPGVISGPPSHPQSAAAFIQNRPSPRLLSVVHETTYTYIEPIEASHQLLRLQPTNDIWQEVLEHELIVEPAGDRRDYEDVFGNQVTQVSLNEPYSKLHIRMKSLVRLNREKMLTLPHQRSTMPLVWMPWQRQMMHAYLQPMELPETQLKELGDYAMSFADRRDYDLIETLVDMNNAIHRDYEYLSGSTTNETTPFEVYTHRKGVCQDFANLFICMARMLGIPARYRVGYIHTGTDYENQVQSDATHAWAEAYLPSVGWRGFDPTNGCLVGPDHIRIAVGRNYRDATPTSGTIYRGGFGETLSVSVEVTPET